MIQIRQAETKDVSAISDLYRQLVHPVAPDIEIDVRGDRIDEIRADPHNFLFVLDTGDAIYGTALLTLCLDPMYQYQPYALVENIVVEESQQGKGYGTMLCRYPRELLSATRLLENHALEQQPAFGSTCLLRKARVLLRTQERIRKISGPIAQHCVKRVEIPMDSEGAPLPASGALHDDEIWRIVARSSTQYGRPLLS
jgi:GNAT superfamily N-acetyltransferase